MVSVIVKQGNRTTEVAHFFSEPDAHEELLTVHKLQLVGELYSIYPVLLQGWNRESLYASVEALIEAVKDRLRGTRMLYISQDVLDCLYLDEMRPFVGTNSVILGDWETFVGILEAEGFEVAEGCLSFTRGRSTYCEETREILTEVRFTDLRPVEVSLSEDLH